MESEKYIKQITLSLLYIFGSFLLGKHGWVIGITLVIICFNFKTSLRYLLAQGKITLHIILLNLTQLGLFCLLHIQIYTILGPSHYTYTSPPCWYDWIQLIAVHVLRAVDLLDIIEAYGIHLQNLKNQTIVSGLALFGMHLMVDIFILGAAFNAFARHSRKSPTLTQLMDDIENTVTSPRTLLILALVVFGYLTVQYLNTVYLTGKKFQGLSNFFLWPLDNILRTLDVGDAFQIFGWRLHTVETSLNSATVAVYFRFITAFYTLGLVNHLYLHILKGQGRSIDDLASICTSSRYTSEKRLIALKALEKYGSYSYLVAPPIIESLADISKRQDAVLILLEIGEPAIPHLAKSLADSNGELRKACADTLETISPQWHISRTARAAIFDLVKTLADNDSTIRYSALRTLEKIDPEWRQSGETRSAVPELIRLLSDTSIRVRVGAVHGLVLIGPAAEKAIFRLVRMMTDSNETVRNAAVWGLEQINPRWQESESAHNAIPYLVKAVTKADWNVRRAALESLEKIDPRWHRSPGARSTVPYLRKVLAKTKDSGIRNAVISVLDKINPE
jgi:HEAT repeat protein